MEENYLSDKKRQKDINYELLIDNFHLPKKDDLTNNTILLEPKKLQKKISNKTYSGKRIKVSEKDVSELCDQLKRFNSRLHSAKDIIHLRYDLPIELQESLEAETEELMCLYKELQGARNNIEVIRNQRLALDKERVTMETEISKLKAEAAQELEIIVSIYDSAMFEKWQKIKALNSVYDLENFLHDVKGKLEAMKNLEVLGAQKLQDLKKKGDKTSKKLSWSKKKTRKSSTDRNTNSLNDSTTANASQTSLQFLMDSDSDEDLDESSDMNSVLYRLVCGQLRHNTPLWEDPNLD